MCAAAIGTTSLNTLRPSWRKVLSRASGSESSLRLMKPKLLRIALENCVASLVPTISHWSDEVAVSALSMTVAVHTSPKMKWQSRSFHSMCADVISGFTTSAHLTLPERTALTACSMAKVADEHATFMSKP